MLLPSSLITTLSIIMRKMMAARVLVFILIILSSQCLGFHQSIAGNKPRRAGRSNANIVSLLTSPKEGEGTTTNGESEISGDDVPPKQSRRQNDSKEGEGTKTNGESKFADNDVPSKKRRRRRRKNADFPSFTYSKRGDYPCVSGKQFKFYRVEDMPDTSPSRIVSVPEPKEFFDKEEGWPYANNLLMRVMGSTLETSGIFDTERVLPTAKQTRLLTDRAYARSEPFAAENITVPPSLDDLAARPREPFEGFWISTPARFASFALSYFSFPYLTRLLANLVTMRPEQLDDVTSKFSPGISILYGTFISLTLSILYNRQRDIQDNVAIECALLTTITRSLLSLFRDYKEQAIEAGQCAADQVRTLVRSSRGAELMLLMYSDPYARMLELVDSHEEYLFREKGGTGSSASRMAYSRDTIRDISKVRANRLSDESLALPPTHFQILNILTLLILIGYTVSILPTVPKGTGEPLDESCFLFALLTSTYVIFYNFASDLNNPFRGVYQLRRSCAASHLLEIKWLITNHPLLRGEVDFEEVVEEPAGVQIRSPGLGDFWFERDEIYVDMELEENLSD